MRRWLAPPAVNGDEVASLRVATDQLEPVLVVVVGHDDVPQLAAVEETR